jgi:phage FluMu protein Com
MPFSLSKEAAHQALDTMAEQALHHYNIQCPHCRKLNRIARKEFLRAAPGWVKTEAKPTEESTT